MTQETAQPAPRSHRRAVWTTILSTQLVLAMLTALGVFLVHKSLNDSIDPGVSVEHEVEKAPVEGPSEPLNILVMGSDTRAGEGNGIDAENADGGQRSDTVILLHVSADRKDAYGVSLPRDAIIDRPDCTVDGEEIPGEDTVMFNTAFAAGGPQCTLTTVERLTGIHIDHFLALDFAGFREMVDAIDGVEVCLPTAVEDYEHNIFLDAGVQTLQGQDALNYVRERTQLSVTGDIGRMKRQQAFIASMVNKVLSAGTLSQPGKVIDFLTAVTSSIQVDDELDTVGELQELAMEFRGTGLDQIKFITVPIAEYEPDPNRLIWTDEADDLWERITADQLLGRDFNAGSINAGDDVGTADSDDDGEDADQRRAAGLCA